MIDYSTSNDIIKKPLLSMINECTTSSNKIDISEYEKKYKCKIDIKMLKTLFFLQLLIKIKKRDHFK